MATRPDVLIRELTSDDYPALAEIYNANDPDDLQTAEGIADRDKRRDPKCKHLRLVATSEQSVVGSAIFTQNIYTYAPHRFFVGVQVLPSYQRRGIGSTLFDQLEAQLQRHDPKELRAFAREDWVAGQHILESQGFNEYTRMAESHLDVAAFDLTPYAEMESILLQDGIEIRTLQELADDPDRNRKLHELEWEVAQDMPDAVDFSRVELSRWIEDTINHPESIPDGYFVAIKENEYIGMSVLFKNEADESLRHGLTGVVRAFRGKGIAVTLKVKTISYAKSHGHPVIKTHNEINNAPMLVINNRLGFVKQPEWIQYQKNCSDEESGSGS